MASVRKWAIVCTLCIIAGAVSVLFLCKQPAPNSEPFDSRVASELGYKPARVVKPSNMPDIKPVAGATPIVAGSGYVVRLDSLPAWPDTLPVEVSVIEDPAGGTWVGVWVAGQPVHWEQLDVAKRDHLDSNWQAVAEVSAVAGRPDFGVGAAWTPFQFACYSGGLSATIDLNREIDTTPDWFAVSGHLSRHYGPVHLGAHVGYRFGQDAGLHLGVCVGVGLDL